MSEQTTFGKIIKEIRRGKRFSPYNCYKYLKTYIYYRKHNDDVFETELAFVAIIKNEAPYIREWLEFHKLVGVEKFYIYDNESTDNVKDILAPYIEKGEVIYHFFPGKSQQIPAYKDAIKRYKSNTKWLGVLDLDEFVIPVEKDSILEVINEIDDLSKLKMAGLAINWHMYGFGGNYNKVDGLVSKNFRHRANNYDVAIKSIVNPRAIVKVKCPHCVAHIPTFHTIDEKGKRIKGSDNKLRSFEKIRINHYWTKSYEEFIQKINRGCADGAPQRELPPYDPSFLSEIEDGIMDKYMPALTKALSDNS